MRKPPLRERQRRETPKRHFLGKTLAQEGFCDYFLPKVTSIGLMRVAGFVEISKI
jgi:hypothetical protein